MRELKNIIISPSNIPTAIILFIYITVLFINLFTSDFEMGFFFSKEVPFLLISSFITITLIFFVIFISEKYNTKKEKAS